MTRTGLGPLDRRALLWAGLSAWMGVVRAAAAEPVPVVDLQAQVGRTAPQPLVVLVSLPGCPWCRIVRDQHLAPLQQEGRLRFVELSMNDTDAVWRAPDGRLTSPAQLAKDWRVRLAPTLVFLNAAGREAADRLVGVPSLDYYAHILAQRLQSALKPG